MPSNEISLPEFKTQYLELQLVGDSPLIVHAWSHKAKTEMLEKQMKKAKQAKAVRDPEQEYKDSLYTMPDGDGYGFPVIAFKAAAVRAANDAGMKMTEARRAFHIDGELVKINGEPRMREDMVKIGMGTADLRYRGEFTQWSVTLLIKFNSHVISQEQIANLFALAGFGVGVGEWRPEKSGSFGRFHVALEKELS